MKRQAINTIGAIFAFACLFDHVMADDGLLLEVDSLQCEYLDDPIGIDVVRPRLSWRIRSKRPDARNVRQSGYQILAASTLENIQNDFGDLWDSSRTHSDQSLDIVYDGKPLTSRAVCYWKVRIWDRKGQVSAWSAVGSWSMGLLARSDWAAQWIGVASQQQSASVDPWFRKTFELSAAPVRAFIYVASLGYHELHINGGKFDDRVLTPSVADVSKRVRYVTYDVTDRLRIGNNTLGLWCAAGWAGFPEFKIKDKPLALAQLEILHSDGRKTVIGTDSTWKSHASPLSQIGKWAKHGYGGERHDARLDLSGWCDAGTDVSDWDFAATYSPNVMLSAEMVQPNRRLQEITPVSIIGKGHGEFCVDMGQNYSGWFQISLTGKPGQKVTFQFSERPDQKSTFHKQPSEYIIGNSGKGVFCQRFNYAAGRWITISGLEASPAKVDIRGYPISTDCKQIATFSCSNELLNRIYRTTTWTYRSLSLGGYVVDCPHREWLGYGGDAHATMEMAMTNYAVGAFYTKWLQDWRDVQHSDGNMPYTAPTYIGGGGPAWSGICIALPWQLYLHYGDRQILETCYPMMQRWVAFLNTKAKNHQLQPWGGIWDFLGDWVPPNVGQLPGERVDDNSTCFFNNCYYADSVNTLAQIAELLGKTEDAAKYRVEAQAIAQKTHDNYFDPKSCSYANGAQLYEALPLLIGVTPTRYREAVFDRLVREIVVTRKGHLDTGIHGTYYLLKCLLNQNRNDLIFSMVNNKDFPGWGYMLDHGATTLWEEWNGRGSLLHSSFVSVGAWFVEGVLGIQMDPTQPGYKHFFVRPGVVGDLTFADGEFQSRYGKIECHWTLSNGILTLLVTVPPNTTATVIMPTGSPSSITENDMPVNKCSDLRIYMIGKNTTSVKIGSGRYAFRVQMHSDK